MLAAAGSVVVPIAIVLLTISFSVAVLMAMRRGVGMMRGSLVVRDGRPALSDEARARLEKRGLDVAKIEGLVAKTYTVNERGEIVMRGESTETETSAPAAPAPAPDPFTQAKPEPAGGDDRFDSIWERQDAGPSIWDEKDKTAFWGDAEKRK